MAHASAKGSPEDFVIATGRQESVRRFIELAALELGWGEIQWSGVGRKRLASAEYWEGGGSLTHTTSGSGDFARRSHKGPRETWLVTYYNLGRNGSRDGDCNKLQAEKEALKSKGLN